MVLFLIIGLVLNFLCGFACLILNFNFIYVAFMCVDAGVLAFLIPAYVTSKKEEKILEFWNKVGKLPPDMQKVILDVEGDVVCPMCHRSMSKYDSGDFYVSKNGQAIFWCKRCGKKKFKWFVQKK